jgi:hypothetical protein
MSPVTPLRRLFWANKIKLVSDVLLALLHDFVTIILFPPLSFTLCFLRYLL